MPFFQLKFLRLYWLPLLVKFRIWKSEWWTRDDRRTHYHVTIGKLQITIGRF
jgi:hypothetical protein